LSQFTRLIDRRTDGRTDGQTEFSLVDRICIPCSAVKTVQVINTAQCAALWYLFCAIVRASEIS